MSSKDISTSDRIIEDVPTWYYAHFGADHDRDIPAESYGGWKSEKLPINLDRTALCVMHAWETPDPMLRGIYSAVEYLPRSDRIMRERFPPVLKVFRNAGVKIVHVEAGVYVDKYDEYAATKDFVAKELSSIKRQTLPNAEPDDVYNRLRSFRAEKAHPGAENYTDIKEAYAKRDISSFAKPLPGEYMVTDADQLQAVCNRHKINNLIYIGFAINCCLLMSPAGMMDMSSRGFICSTIKELTTAVENNFSARFELGKQIGLWHTALFYGFVYEQNDIEAALRSVSPKLDDK